MDLQKAVFLDRDGTLIEDKHFLSSADAIHFLPGVLEGLKTLKKEGFKLILITNQSGIGRGLFSVDTLNKIHGALQQVLNKNNSSLDAIYFCPHRPEDACSCRKPKNALFTRAIEEQHIDAKSSYALGDRNRDVEPAKVVGCKTIHVGPAEAGPGESPEIVDYIAPDFSGAVQWILRDFTETARFRNS